MANSRSTAPLGVGSLRAWLPSLFLLERQGPWAASTQAIPIFGRSRVTLRGHWAFNITPSTRRHFTHATKIRKLATMTTWQQSMSTEHVGISGVALHIVGRRSERDGLPAEKRHSHRPDRLYPDSRWRNGL